MARETDDAPDGAGDYVPVIDLTYRHDPAQRATIAKEIAGACETSGFYIVVGHGIPDDLIRRMYGVTHEFFALPEGEKDRIANRPGVSGFRRTGGSTAHSLDEDSPPDLCEAFAVHVTGELSEAERSTLGNEFATWSLANLWPEKPEPFRAVWEEYLAAMEELAADLMRLSALALGLPERFFEDKFDHDGSSLTANYYFPVRSAPLPGQLRRGAHTDFGGLTVLYQDEADGGGLQVQQGSTWRDVPAIPGSFVVNIGDLMALWTGGRWVSTMHRVVNPERSDLKARISVPFFYLPNHDAVVEPMEPASADRQAPATVVAGEWMSRKIEKLFTGVG